MFPVRLSWQLPQDGVAIDSPGDDLVFRPRSDRFIAVEVTVRDLEEPACVSLANCAVPEDFKAFITRRGFLSSRDGPEGLSLLAGTAEDMNRDLAICNAPEMEKVRRANELLEDSTRITFDFQLNADTGRPEIVHRVDSLYSLLLVELVLAFQCGAAFSRCQHCSRGFLTGYLTGRRSTSTYCSDRCRVAAMRARKMEGN